MTRHPAKKKRRIVFVDLLRLIAAFQMIHGHTLHALMADDLRTGLVFARWSWGRGLVSVSFMFAAGVAFSLSTLDRLEKHRGDRKITYRRFRRIAWLVILGYLLHFPDGLFAGGEAMRRSLEMFQMVDVLQCIGVSVLVLQILAMVLPSKRAVVWATTALSALFIAAAPLADAVVVGEPLPRFIANYFTHSGGSLFPLFPWTGYVLAGVACAGWVLPDGINTHPSVPAPRLLTLAVLVLGASYLATALPLTLATDLTSHQAMPWFAMRKIGFVVLLVAGLAFVSRNVTTLPKWLRVLAGESLTLYVFHLLVLYAGGIGLSRIIGHSLPLDQALVIALLMVALSATAALTWHQVKAWRPWARGRVN